MVIYPNKHNMEVNIALLTVTDTRTIENDKSGGILVQKIKEQKHKLVDRKIVKDDKEEIKKTILEWSKKDQIDVIITTGGTGLTGRDITPEALDEIADKKIPGFGELFRQLSYKTVGTSTLQSRASAILKNGKNFMKLNAVRSMLVISLIIILVYVLGLFLPIIKNTKETKIFNHYEIESLIL